MTAAQFSTARKTFEPSRLQRLGKELAWITLGNAAAMLGALVGIRVLTEFLDPGAYGQLALGLTLATLVNQTVMGPLTNGAARFYAPAVQTDDLGGYLKVVRRLVFLAIGIVALLMLSVLAALFLAGRAEWIALGSAALIFAIATGCNSILSGIQSAARQRSIVALHQGLEPWGRFLIAASMAMGINANSTMVLLGYAAAVSLVLGSQYLFFRPVVAKSLLGSGRESNWQEKIWTYSWPFASWGVFGWAQQTSDRWALGLFGTTKEVGLYAVLFQLGYYPISVATGIAMQLIAPIFYERAGDGTDARRNASVTRLSFRLAGLALCITGAAFIVALAFHAQIFRVFVAAEYTSVSHLLPWMLLGGGVFASGQIISLDLMSQMRTRSMMVAKIATALLGVGLNITGAYWYGMSGIVLAVVVFSVAYFLWMVLLARKNPLVRTPL